MIKRLDRRPPPWLDRAAMSSSLGKSIEPRSDGKSRVQASPTTSVAAPPTITAATSPTRRR